MSNDDAPRMHFNTDQSQPLPMHQLVPMLTESQRQNFGPFSPITNADACAVLNHLLAMSGGDKKEKS